MQLRQQLVFQRKFLVDQGQTFFLIIKDTLVGNLEFLKLLYPLCVEENLSFKIIKTSGLLVELLPALMFLLAHVDELLLLLTQLSLKALLSLNALSIRLVDTVHILEETVDLTLLLGNFGFKFGNPLFKQDFTFFKFL